MRGAISEHQDNTAAHLTFHFYFLAHAPQNQRQVPPYHNHEIPTLTIPDWNEPALYEPSILNNLPVSHILFSPTQNKKYTLLPSKHRGPDTPSNIQPCPPTCPQLAHPGTLKALKRKHFTGYLNLVPIPTQGYLPSFRWRHYIPRPIFLKPQIFTYRIFPFRFPTPSFLYLPRVWQLQASALTVVTVGSQTR